MYRIGIDLGGTNIAVGVVDDRHNIIAEASVPTGAFRPAEEMVADMCRAVEMAPEKVFLAQKYMLHEAALRGRFTITATQMLDSMIRKPR